MNKFLRTLIPILLALFILACTGWYLLYYDAGLTQSFLISQARSADRNGHTAISAWFYSLAYSQSGNDEDVAIELSNQYRYDGNYTKAEVTLSNAIKAHPSVSLYQALCQTYIDQDKLMDAAALLAGITDEGIRAEIERLRPTAPVAAQASGFYNEYINVALSTSSGTILYTVNADYPSVNGPVYSEPIPLAVGETVIRAISVGKNGLVSTLSVLGYTVGGVVEPAIFTDGNVEAAVRNLLNVSATQKLYTNDLWQIREFTVPSSAATLADLAMFTHLETLKVDHVTSISSLSVLEGMTELQNLDLSGCRFPSEELSVLAKLPKLTSLDISDCGLTTISALAGLTGLESLNLNMNTLRNLDVVSDMEHLKELYVNHNAVESLEFLGHLFDLEKLDISSNAVSSLIPLGACTRLKTLDASNNIISSVNGIASLPLLSELSLSANQLSDVSSLGNSTQLTSLDISRNSIYDISMLYNLTDLLYLDISENNISGLPNWTGGMLRELYGSRNSITDISMLAHMQELTYVELEYNQITDISSLANCYNLVQVNVFGNQISSVAELLEHNIIVNYDPTAIQ